MNNYYNFTLTGGFPLDQGVLNDLQNGILEVEGALAALLGPFAIISGCTVTGGVAANGVVAVNGVIMPFVGGAVGTNVIPVTTATDLTYFSDAINPSLTTQYATFGTDGVHTWPWAAFVSNNGQGNSVMWLTGDVKEVDCSEDYITANFDDTGLGLSAGQRYGWAICNGNNGTVNRLGAVPVQRDPSITAFNAMGNTGGEVTHTLVAGEIPELQSEDSFEATDGGSETAFGANSISATLRPLSINASGGAAHNNLQPYIVTLFIQKL